MDFGSAARTYTLMTIGDGLVAQIPALVISTAAGVTVSRVNTDQDVGQQMISQLFVNPQVMILAAAVMGLLGLVPGMPNVVFLIFTVLLGGLAWWLIRQKEQRQVQEELSADPLPAPEAPEASWDDVQLVDTLGLEVGHRLIPLVDQRQEGELLGRIKSVRKKFAQEVGFLPPVVHIRDNLELGPNSYVITLKGAEIGRAEAHPGKWLAIDPGQVSGELQGTRTRDPAFGLPAVWIDAGQREHAQVYGYTVVDASTVVATHLNHLLHQHAAEMLGRVEVQKLLDKLGEENKSLVEEVVPKALSLTVFQRILQNLLDEEVSIRDLRSILDTLAEHAGQQQDAGELTGADRPGSQHRPAVVPRRRRAEGDRVGGPARAGADAGDEWQRCPGAGPGRDPDEPGRAGAGAPGGQRRAPGAGGTAHPTPGAGALPAPTAAPPGGDVPGLHRTLRVTQLVGGR